MATSEATTANAWMKNIAETKFLDELNIPGTHDTGTYTASSTDGFGVIKTQSLDITTQLFVGIRYLDIRCRHINDRFAIHHDLFYLNLSFDNVLQNCVDFLNTYPTETIIMQVKDEYTAQNVTRSYYETFMYYVNKYQETNSSLFYLGGSIPQLKDVRGKIVIVRRFTVPSNITCGINTPYRDNTTFTVNLGGGGENGVVEIQDQYQLTSSQTYSNKWTAINNLFSKAKDKNMNERHWFINYCSAAPSNVLSVIAGNIPVNIAHGINPRLSSYMKANTKNFLGTVIMDFPDYPDLKSTVDLVVARNTNV